MHMRLAHTEPQSWKGFGGHPDQRPYCTGGETEARKGEAELGPEPRSPALSAKLIPEAPVSLPAPVHHIAPFQM